MAVVVWALYAALVFTVQKAMGVPYQEWGDSPQNLWRGAVVSLIVGGALTAILTTILGWWRPVLFETRRDTVRWAWISPIAMILLLAVNLAAIDYATLGPEFLLAAGALGLGVGFAEEMFSRGLMLVSLRSALTERSVWIWTSLAFGTFHLINIGLGAPVVTTLVQVVQASLSGTIFYLARRLSGTLIVPMALHGAWDFAQFAQPKAPLFDPASSLIVFIGVFAVFAAWRMTSPERKAAH